MKYKTDFTTNSSSSSYVCEICGDDVSGMDMSLSEAKMYECENGHVFCNSHSTKSDYDLVLAKVLKEVDYWSNKKPDKYYTQEEINENKENEQKLFIKLQSDKDYDIDDLIYEYELNSDFPESCCPICKLEELQDYDILKYIIKTKNLNLEEIEKEIRNKFTNLTELQNYYNNKKLRFIE